MFSGLFSFYQGDVKLSSYGTYHMTEYGSSVQFPIGYVAISD